MAKKAKQEKTKWVPKEGEPVWLAIVSGSKAEAYGEDYVWWLANRLRAGLIYRTKREALACARRMLKAAKEG